MNSFYKQSKMALLLGAVFILGGILMILHPREMVVTPDGPPNKRKFGGDKPQAISQAEMRFTGGVAIVAGAGILFMALYRRGN